MWRRLSLVVVAVSVVLAARADAATYCVGMRTAGCTAKDTAADAFAAARADPERDTILLGRLTADGPFADAAGRPVRVLGVGADATRLRQTGSGPALRLQDAGSSAAGVRVDGGVQIDDGASVSATLVFGRVVVRGGAAELSSVVASGPGPGVDVTCDASAARVSLDHVTVVGSGDPGVRGECATPGRTVAIAAANSIVWGFERAFAPGARASVATSWSNYPGATGDTNTGVNPGFAAAGDWRLPPDSPLVDAGRPGALAEGESHEDALGYVRVVDGNGDGGPRRDVGAHELQPPAPPVLAGNVLANPGAEQSTPADDDRASPSPPGWTRTGSFTFVRYGTVAGLVPFPSQRVADALSAGTAFFAAGPGKDGSATQVAPVAAAAPEIDLGRGAVTLAALLGGYRGSGDGAIAEAVFRDPGGRALGSTRIGPVTAADRANATTLLPRASSVAIPPLTRTIAVTLRSTPPAGAYDDAYFDSVALVPQVDGRPPHVDPQPARPRPFPGVTLTRRRAAVDSRRRVWMRLGCGSSVVRRCTGVLTVTARLARRAPERRIASRAFEIRRGKMVRLSVALTRAGRRAIGARRRLPGHAYLAARDGQGLTRTSTSPVRVVRGRRFARR